MKELSSEQVDYVSNEIGYLRRTYLESAKETRTLERYTLLATGGIWSWYAANYSENGNLDRLTFILWLPAIITVLFGLRAWGISRLLVKIKKYFAYVEGQYQLPSGLGWEQQGVSDRTRFEIMTVYLFWLLIQIATVLVPIVVIYTDWY